MNKLAVIDLFCGAGGTTTGVEKAKLKGRKIAKVIACVNHDPMAIASHKANHSEVLHFTEDVRTLNIDELKAIQGFPKDYILKGNKTDQKKFIGNSVVPVMSKVLIQQAYISNCQLLEKTA